MSSIAPGGMETPVRRYSSALQLKRTNSRSSFSASSTRIPASMTSGPMPSPGTTAIFFVIRGGGLYVRRRRQLDVALLDRGAHARVAQRGRLLVPRVTPVRVVAGDAGAGMRDELGDAVDFVEQLDDPLRGEMPRLGHADRAVVLAASAAAEAIQYGDRGAAQLARAAAAVVDATDVRDVVLLRQPLHDAKEARPHVQVLVAVHVRDVEAGAEHFLDLRAHLPLRIGTAAAEQPARVIPRHERAGRERALLDQREVNADFEPRQRAQAVDGIVELEAVRHDAARGHDSFAMRADRPLGHASIEADVVGSDDEVRLHCSCGRTLCVPTASGAGRGLRTRISG